MSAKPRVSTAYVGQFEHANAEAIAKALEEAGIVWYSKQAGGIAQFLFRSEWGVRLFADRARMDDVRAIVERVAARAKNA